MLTLTVGYFAAAKFMPSQHLAQNEKASAPALQSSSPVRLLAQMGLSH
jgi:predicted exporter